MTGGGREDSVLGEDEEVMRLLQGRPKLYGASRSSCPNPVASELQMVRVWSIMAWFNFHSYPQCYFVPVCI